MSVKWPECSTQPRYGQAYDLPVSANTDPRTTHVAVHRLHDFKYFCWFDSTTKSPHDGVPDYEVLGEYWIVPCVLYGRCYNGASLWQGGFDFIPLVAYRAAEQRARRNSSERV